MAAQLTYNTARTYKSYSVQFDLLISEIHYLKWLITTILPFNNDQKQLENRKELKQTSQIIWCNS